MALYNLDESITEEDLSGVSQTTRQPIYLYVQAESDAGLIEFQSALQQFLKTILETPVLNSCADVEICVFNHDSNKIIKECGAVTNSDLTAFSDLPAVTKQSIHLAPVLDNALARIASQKRKYRENRISYNKPSLLLFTNGNIADELWKIQEVVARTLRENSVDILTISNDAENPKLKAISSKGKVLQLPPEQAYMATFQGVCASMEQISESTTAAYQELVDCLVESTDYFK